MKIFYRIAVLLLLVAILISVLMRNKKQISYQSGTAKQIISEIPVAVKPAKMSQPTIVIQTAGMVESTEDVVVVAAVQGAVKNINITVGKSVKEGDLLVSVDDYYAMK
jgi:multidrug efflux pump subunit AcrA (membrane-fusion protein)